MKTAGRVGREPHLSRKPPPRSSWNDDDEHEVRPPALAPFLDTLQIKQPGKLGKLMQECPIVDRSQAPEFLGLSFFFLSFIFSLPSSAPLIPWLGDSRRTPPFVSGCLTPVSDLGRAPFLVLRRDSGRT